MSKPELSVRETMKRYPCIVSHVISESFGYAIPLSCAARVLKNAREGRENFCEGNLLMLRLRPEESCPRLHLEPTLPSWLYGRIQACTCFNRKCR